MESKVKRKRKAESNDKNDLKFITLCYDHYPEQRICVCYKRKTILHANNTEATNANIYTD